MCHLRSSHSAVFAELFPAQSNKRSADAADLHELDSSTDGDAAAPPTAAACAAAASTPTSSASVVSSSSKKSQLTLTQSLAKSTAAATLEKLATAFACSSIAYSVVETPQFRAFLSAMVWPGLLPSRHAVRAATIRCADKLRAEIGAKLQDAVITIACDGWTNVKHQKVTNAVLMMNGRAFYWSSFINSGENTAIWLASQLRPLIHSLTLEFRARVIGVVVDNEAVNAAAHRLLVADMPFLVHVPCAAHTVQLVVRNCLAEPQLAPIVEQLLALIRFFDCKENRIALQQQQTVRGAKATLGVLKTCDTRWHSLLRAAQRMELLEKDVKRCYDADSLSAVNADFWKQLPQLIDFLKPFMVATDRIQCDSATLVTVFHEFHQLRKHLQQHSWALKWLDARWERCINGDAVAACALLSFDPIPADSNVTISAAQKFIVHFGSGFLLKYQLSEDADEQTAADALLMEIADFHGKEGVFDGMASAIAAAQRAAVASAPTTAANDENAAPIRWQPRRVWNLFAHTRLSKVATALLSLSASEAAVERTFSAQGLVHSELRNSLKDEAVQAEMMLKFNTTSAHEPAAAAHFGCIEMTPDSSKEDEDAATLAPDAVDREEQTSFDDVSDMQLDEDEVKEEAAPGSSAQQRALRRAASETFSDMSSFISWFISENHLSPGCRFNADLLLALERHSSKLVGTPGTATLQAELRKALKSQ